MRKLGLKCALRNSKVKQLVFLVCVGCAVIVYFLLTRIDLIVHEQLYDFGLVFSTEWVDPYRALMWSIYACLVTSVVLSGIVLASSLFSKQHEVFNKPSSLERARKVAAKLPPLKLPGRVEASRLPQGLSEEHFSFEDGPQKASESQMFPKKNQSLRLKNSEVETQHNRKPLVEAGSEAKSEKRVNNTSISCPKCRRIFQTPLVMLDFRGAKPELMNVCPYCNQVLGSSETESDVNCDLT